MNKADEIIKIKSNNYVCIVMPTSISNPLEKVSALSEELKRECIQPGRILFDFIISSGNTRERYASVLYENGFAYNSFEYVDVKPDDPIRKESSDFLRAEIENLKC